MAAIEDDMEQRWPIDARRNSAFSGKVGSDGDDSAIHEMIPLGDFMYVVKERGVYSMQLADQIDPGRTNISVPNVQQKILPIGSSDPIVARTLLTAHTLFKAELLGPSFNEKKGVELMLELLKSIVAMIGMRVELEAADAQARAAFEARAQACGALALPAIANLKARCDAFSQKGGHVVDILENIAKLFYRSELKSKWIDALCELTAQRYGEGSPFAQYMTKARPFLLFVRDMRNMIEHPKDDKHVKVRDFRLLPSTEIAPPTFEIVRPGEGAQSATITLLMTQIVDDLVSVTEVLIVYLCRATVQPFAGFAINVVELPLEQRSNKEQRFYYGCQHGGQIVRFG